MLFSVARFPFPLISLPIPPSSIPGGEQRALPLCSVASGGVGEGRLKPEVVDNSSFRLLLVESLS